MKFSIEMDSSVPAHTQIKERIKAALLLRELRPGDTLPSIRDLEKQLGIGRAIIRRAYLELQEAGILAIKPGRRVCVSEVLQLRTNESVIRSIEALADKTLQQVRKLNVSNSSFAKLLLQRALQLDRTRLSYVLADSSEVLAQKLAARISHLWEVPIHATSIIALPQLFKSGNHHIHKIIVNYYRYDEVSELLKELKTGEHTEVVPISLRFADEMIRQIKALPPGTEILLVAEDREYERHGQAFADAYKQAFHDLSVEFLVRPISNIKHFEQLVRSKKYPLVFVSNSIWDKLPAKVQKLKGLSHPQLEIDPLSLEEARMSAGIVI